MMQPHKSNKEDVRHFYDQVGWQLEDGEHYQNAHYEDLRPVSQEYIHRCHLRVNRHLKPNGKFLLDAGSGPIQYPEYLTYSEHYQYRVCADISIVALKEARKRTGAKGLMVVADVANLPFKQEKDNDVGQEDEHDQDAWMVGAVAGSGIISLYSSADSAGFMADGDNRAQCGGFK